MTSSLGEGDADRFGLFEREEAGRRGETEGGIAGRFGLSEEVVVGPAAADEAVTGQHIGLGLGEFFVLCLAFGIGFGAVVEFHEGLD